MGTVFLLLLLWTTIRSTGTPLGQSSEERTAAQRTCRDSVRAQVPEARFPFAANVEDQGSGRLRLSGSVDAGSANRTVRRNYQCFVRREPSGAYSTDSVRVWQSH